MTSRLKKIEEKIGTLSNTTKMPSYSWGIPTEYCQTGMKLAKIPGTICYKCYADKGFYKMPVVNAMYQKRYDAIDMPEWVDYMSELITQKYKKLTKSRLYHRWFDSGDIQSYSHLMKIFEVCELTPHIKHWVATREYSIVDKVDEKDVPKNLCLRVSATKVDSPPPDRKSTRLNSSHPSRSRMPSSAWRKRLNSSHPSRSRMPSSA